MSDGLSTWAGQECGGNREQGCRQVTTTEGYFPVSDEPEKAAIALLNIPDFGK